MNTGTREITIKRDAGVGSHQIVYVFVDGEQWASVRYWGRQGWHGDDMEGHTQVRAASKDMALTRVAEAIKAGTFPSPEQSWRERIERQLADGIAGAIGSGGNRALFEAARDLIELAAANPDLAKTNTYQRIVAGVEQTYQDALQHWTSKVEHNREFDAKIDADPMWQTEDRRAYLSKSRTERDTDLNRDLAYAREQLARWRKEGKV